MRGGLPRQCRHEVLRRCDPTVRKRGQQPARQAFDLFKGIEERARPAGTRKAEEWRAGRQEKHSGSSLRAGACTAQRTIGLAHHNTHGRTGAVEGLPDQPEVLTGLKVAVAVDVVHSEVGQWDYRVCVP